MSVLTNIYGDITEELRSLRSYHRQYAINKDRQIRFYNWWSQPYDRIWLYRFIKARNLVPEGKILNFVSVFGRKGVIRYLKEPTIFFTAENIHNVYQEYADYGLTNDDVQLGLGFDYFSSDNYLRFPLWLIYMFPYEMTESEIRKRCEELRYPTIGNRTKFASMVARYDWTGGRMMICNGLEKIDFVSCPSKVNHNDDTLITEFNDNKAAYLRQFAFNICPENTDSLGYVTEKLFQAISAGCVPIYWGSGNQPEPNVINQEAVVFWDMKGDNSQTIEFVEDLWKNKKRMEEYLHQPRLLPNAEDVVLDYIENLSERIKALVE